MVHNLRHFVHMYYVVLILPSKTERVLFHFNGHGVPKPTSNGEIWFFNKVWSFNGYSLLTGNTCSNEIYLHTCMYVYVSVSIKSILL